jgi:hypothetical protein
MAIIVMTTGSLIPAMIVHALIDICGGTVGYWLLRDAVSAEKGPPARSTAAFTLAADG